MKNFQKEKISNKKKIFHFLIIIGKHLIESSFLKLKIKDTKICFQKL